MVQEKEPVISQIKIGNDTYSLLDKHHRSLYTTFYTDVTNRLEKSNGFNTQLIQKDDKENEKIVITKQNNENKITQMEINSNDIELKKIATNETFLKIHVPDNTELDKIILSYIPKMDDNENFNYADNKKNNLFNLKPDAPIYQGNQQNPLTSEEIINNNIKVYLIKQGRFQISKTRTFLLQPSYWDFINGYESITFKDITDPTLGLITTVESRGYEYSLKIEYGDLIQIEYIFERNLENSQKYYTLGYRSLEDTIGNFSFVEGYNNIASGDYAHAEGIESEASGETAHVEGRQNLARGSYSHAEGLMTETLLEGEAAHAEGAQTIAINKAAHAEGFGTIAAGEHSHAGGVSSEANGAGSFSHGAMTIANGDSQIVVGKYNIPDLQSLFIVGNGNEDQRSNILKTGNYGGVPQILSYGDIGIISSNIILEQTSDTIDGNTHIYFQDKNEKSFGSIYPRFSSDGTVSLIVSVNNIDEYNQIIDDNYISMGTTKAGNPVFQMPESTRLAFLEALGVNASLLSDFFGINNDQISNYLPITSGGTGAGDAPTARNHLGAIEGVWPIELGGTGATNRTQILQNIGLQGEGGIVLSIQHGGTGVTSLANLRKNLGLGSDTTKPVPIPSGGTGASSPAGALSQLGAQPLISLQTLRAQDLIEETAGLDYMDNTHIMRITDITGLQWGYVIKLNITMEIREKTFYLFQQYSQYYTLGETTYKLFNYVPNFHLKSQYRPSDRVIAQIYDTDWEQPSFYNKAYIGIAPEGGVYLSTSREIKNLPTNTAVKGRVTITYLRK